MGEEGASRSRGNKGSGNKERAIATFLAINERLQLRERKIIRTVVEKIAGTAMKNQHNQPFPQSLTRRAARGEERQGVVRKSHLTTSTQKAFWAPSMLKKAKKVSHIVFSGTLSTTNKRYDCFSNIIQLHFALPSISESIIHFSQFTLCTVRASVCFSGFSKAGGVEGLSHRRAPQSAKSPSATRRRSGETPHETAPRYQ